MLLWQDDLYRVAKLVNARLDKVHSPICPSFTCQTSDMPGMATGGVSCSDLVNLNLNCSSEGPIKATERNEETGREASCGRHASQGC